ncbi:MAG TPA: cache domain-containing protein [Ilumatobacter sp.]|nr:cache domain-containing protein [Ilumatobacter sp.]
MTAAPFSDAEFPAAAAALAHAADDLFAVLEILAGRFVDVWTQVTGPNASKEFVTADIAELQPDVFAAIDGNPAFESAGFVLVEGLVADSSRCLEWWHRAFSGDHDQIAFNLEPGTTDCYDYYSMEWFAAAVNGGRRFVSGPLIDLPCADVYILTFSQPIVADGRLLGVAGADVAVSRFEHRILPPLRTLPRPTLLVNDERRVIASNDAMFTTGEKLPHRPGADNSWTHVLPVTPDLGWLLASGHTA